MHSLETIVNMHALVLYFFVIKLVGVQLVLFILPYELLEKAIAEVIDKGSRDYIGILKKRSAEQNYIRKVFKALIFL